MSYKCAISRKETREITAAANLLPIVETVNSVHQMGTRALFIVCNYILGLILENSSIYPFDSPKKDDND